MNLKSLNNLGIKNKIFLLFAVFVIFAFLIIYFLVSPSIDEIRDLRNEIIDQKIDYINSSEQEKNAEIIDKKINEVEPKMGEYRKYYISENDELSLITALEKVASKNNILQKIDLQFEKKDEESKNKERIIPLELNAIGSYKNILDYLSEIESMNYFIAIKSIELSNQASIGSAVMRVESNDEQETMQKINLKIKADTYFK